MSFREKTPQELESQIEKVETVFGTRLKPRNWKGLSRGEIENDFKVRYNEYSRLLRSSKINKEEESDDINEKVRLLISGLNNLEEFIDAHKEGNQEVLRGTRQVNVFEDLRAFLERGDTEGYIKLPTGVGKTVIFLKLVESLGLKTLIVVPSRVLVGQTGQKLEEFTDAEFGTVFSESQDFSKPVTVTTYSSLTKRIKSGDMNPDDFPVLILDEAHRSLSKERVKAVNLFNGIKVGFTATPTYSKSKNVSSLLETEIHSMHLYEAIEEGLLCETHTIHAHTDVDLSGVSIKSGDYDPEQLEKLINIESRNKAAVELYKKSFFNDKAVCYCSSLNHAKDLEKKFIEESISCALVDGSTPKEEREEIFRKFKSGEIRVLLNVKVLVEGFDEPSCNVVFNLHPTLSLIDAEQRGGRSLRLDKNNPNKIGYVVDFIDNNRENPSILFSEILGGSARVPKTSNISDGKRDGGDKPKEEQPVVIEGLVVVVDEESILRVSQNNALKRENIQKEGWRSSGSLAEELNIHVVTVRKALLDIAETIPDSSSKQRDKETGDLLVFFSPEVVDKAREVLSLKVLVKKEKEKEEEARKKKIQELKSILTLEKIINIPNIKYYCNGNQKGLDRIAPYLIKLRDNLIETLGKSDEIESFSNKVIEKISKAFREVSPEDITREYFTMGDLDKIFEACGVNWGRDGMRFFRSADSSSISVEKIFGENQFTCVADPIKVTKILGRHKNLDKVFSYMETHLDAIMQRIGYRSEESFLSEITLTVLEEKDAVAIKKKYFEIKGQRRSVFRTYKNSSGKEIVYVPNVVIEAIEKMIEKLQKTEV